MMRISDILLLCMIPLPVASLLIGIWGARSQDLTLVFVAVGLMVFMTTIPAISGLIRDYEDKKRGK